MNKSSYFPMFIDICDKNIVIIGAGNIAIRRAKSLIKTGCYITIVAPSILDEFYNLNSPKITIIKDIYNEKYINNAYIVLAITNDEATNNAIYKHCKKNNIIVNVATDKNKTDFFFPALIYKDNTVIGVCGDGTNHKLVKKLADKIRNMLMIGGNK